VTPPATAASNDPQTSSFMTASPAPQPIDPATLAPEAPDPTLLPDAPAATTPGRVTYAAAPPPGELPGALEVGLPELTVDLHIYADDPAKRAVFINGRRYTQGATIAEGPLLEEITRDGAVLSYRGRRFQLPRM
jgi:general secretion pathway protein B